MQETPTEHRPLAVSTGAVNCVALWTRPFSQIRQPFQGRRISRMPKTTKKQCLDHLQWTHRCWGTWPKALSSWHKPLWWNRPNRHTNRRVLNHSYTTSCNQVYHLSKVLLNGAMLLHPVIVSSLGWWPRCYILEKSSTNLSTRILSNILQHSISHFTRVMNTAAKNVNISPLSTPSYVVANVSLCRCWTFVVWSGA